MSEPENFLQRWSRRKQEADRHEAGEEPAPGRENGPEGPQESAAQSEAREPEPEFDVSSLPPLESIGAESDIRAFLQKGVPADLARAALRRVWTADPAIRDFIGIAENQWDFATGSDIPGFGALDPSEGLRQIASRIGSEGRLDRGLSPDEPGSKSSEGEDRPEQSPAEPAQAETQDGEEAQAERVAGQDEERREALPSPDAALQVAQIGSSEEFLQSNNSVATHKDEPASEPMPLPLRRTHGGALPE